MAMALFHLSRHPKRWVSLGKRLGIYPAVENSPSPPSRSGVAGLSIWPTWPIMSRLCARQNQSVKQRAKLSRLGVETASNSFHLGMQPSGILAGGIWSVLHGHYLRDSQAAFSTEANDHSNCPRHGFIPADRAQASQHR